MQYDRDFYNERDNRTQYTAQTILSSLLKLIPSVQSAVDVGCGVGTWLSVLQDKGVTNIQGIDGPWVPQEHLVIPRDAFKTVDLSKESDLSVIGRYDLAINLEVAEHVPAEKAEAFIRFLSTLSDIILFSAAIPGQGGIGHINEQWPSYWIGLFDKLGYAVLDIIRPRIWSDEKIPWWYRQNIMLFIKRGTALNFTSWQSKADSYITMQALPIVHPKLLEKKTQLYTGDAFRLLLACFNRALMRRFRD